MLISGIFIGDSGKSFSILSGKEEIRLRIDKEAILPQELNSGEMVTVETELSSIMANPDQNDPSHITLRAIGIIPTENTVLLPT